jgi:maltooligosyltrehalose trehalohydrolase
MSLNVNAEEFTLGASPLRWGTMFRVWAPMAEAVEVIVESPGWDSKAIPMEQSSDGYFSCIVEKIGAGDLYRYRVDGKGPFPDPASRFQPQGVHGPSQVIDPSSYHWSDSNWRGIASTKLVFYELHIGTFTTTGTFQSAAGKLPLLSELGISAVELMPVADFPGNRNWGYDGVCLFAPARCYGAPDDFRRFVDSAHSLGLAVILDVVYNHFGPDGAYQGTFSSHYFSNKHQSPWGAGINFDDLKCAPVRDYFIENALRWIHEYHLDGLRLDATHAIVDDSSRHIVTSISAAVHASVKQTGRRVHLIAEDVRNLSSVVRPESQNGWGVDAVWSDDFHHQMRRALAGDHDGYFQDFEGTAQSIATTARQGWFYTGQTASYFGGARGTDPVGLDYSKFVFFIQNHDQIGNRAFGDRLNHVISLAAYRAANVLLLLLPECPLLFMGQEWAAATPFLFFTDHNPELGPKVTEGRRREFQRFANFSGTASDAIPDPQSLPTFEASRLNWEEQEIEPHRSMLRLFRRLLDLRRSEPAMWTNPRSAELAITAVQEGVIAFRRTSHGQRDLVVVVRFAGSGKVDLKDSPLIEGPGTSWTCILNSEDASFATDPNPPTIDTASLTLDFPGPAAVVLSQTSGTH